MGSLAAPWRRSGLVTLATLAIIVSACSGSATPAPAASAPAASAAAASPGGLPAASGTTTLGSNESDANPKAAVAAIADYCSKQAGITITINTTDHNTFQNQISSYLQGKPDDVVKWFAGNRLRFFASQGLLTPIDDVWAQIGANYTDAFKTAATGADGHQYLVPSINYPWVVMYRKSLWTKMGYAVPTTITDFVTLAKKMQTDGLVPLAYGDKDGWPAMGTFDILNMRMNGYDFHVGLMAGTEKWTDPKVKAVFQEWASLLPYFQQGAPGRTWQDAATAALVPDASGKYVAGMYFLGTFANAQVPAADQNDIGMFTFPTLGTAYDGENAMDAPGKRRGRQGVPRLHRDPRCAEGLHGRLRRHRRRQECRRQRVHPVPGRRGQDHRRGWQDRPVPGSRRTLGLRGPVGHAGLPPQLPQQPQPGPRQVPERDPGLLRLPAPAVIS